MSQTDKFGIFPIQPDSFKFQRDKMVDIIRDISQARKVFHVGPSIPVHQKITQYFEESEENRVQYNLDLVAPKYSKFKSQEKNPLIPIHQGDLKYMRHELAALPKDPVPVDRRQRLTLEQITEDEERVVFAGDSKIGITSFADTTYNSTAWTGELDLTSYTTAITTYTAGRSQLRALLKSKFALAILKMVWTPDVDDRARVTLNTDQSDNFYDWLVRAIGKENIHSTGYLDSEAGTGTTNAVLVPKNPGNMELISSNLELVNGLTPLKDLEVQMDIRSRAIFYRGVKSSLYSATVDITA
ncbi:MAG: hypothetical protein KAS32_21800 [Candidatus Peribacteraceae bacterium]|nr:hypothetical protein [Candidatus Peribacteraceae bacterium]